MNDETNPTYTLFEYIASPTKNFLLMHHVYNFPIRPNLPEAPRGLFSRFTRNILTAAAQELKPQSRTVLNPPKR